jgi:hypothetical protein
MAGAAISAESCRGSGSVAEFEADSAQQRAEDSVSTEAYSLLYLPHPLFAKDAFMVAPVAAYLVALGTMLFAGFTALTLITVVKHLDPSQHAGDPPLRVPEKIAV